MRFALLLVLVVACKKDKAAEVVTKASCASTASSTCEDYDSKGPAYIESRKKDCKQISGTFNAAACPTSGLLGSCQETTANWTRTRHYYAGTSVDLEKTKLECSAFGKWLEPPKQP